MQPLCDICGPIELSSIIFPPSATASDIAGICVPFCAICGSQLPHIDYSVYNSLVEETPSESTEKRPVFGNTYKRRAHVEERKRMHHRMDPLPPPEDLMEIEKEYQRYRESNMFRRQLSDRGIITKTDVQGVLRSLDKKIGLRGWRKKGLSGPNKLKPTPVQMKQSFTKRYLEKWETLRGFLMGEELQIEPNVPLEKQERDSRVGAAFMAMSARWNEWQNPEVKDKRHEYWKYPERKNFPNFNYFFARLSRVLGAPYERSEFPEPTTPACKAKLAEYFRELATEIGLPGFEKKMRQLSLEAFISKPTSTIPYPQENATTSSHRSNRISDAPSTPEVGGCVDLCSNPSTPQGSDAGTEFDLLLGGYEENIIPPSELEREFAAAIHWIFGGVEESLDTTGGRHGGTSPPFPELSEGLTDSFEEKGQTRPGGCLGDW
jgi:hypothetical protein